MLKEIRGPLNNINLSNIINKLSNIFEHFPSTEKEIYIFFENFIDLRIKINRDGVNLILPDRNWRKDFFQEGKDKVLNFKIVDLNSLIELISIFGIRGGVLSLPHM